MDWDKEQALTGSVPTGVGELRRNPPIRKRLEMQKTELLSRITELDKMLTLLNENPAIETFQDLAAKLGHI